MALTIYPDNHQQHPSTHEIPDHLKPLLLSHFTASYHPFDSGGRLEQEISGGQYALFFQHLFVTTTTTIYFLVQEPAFVFFCIIKGNFECIIGGRRPICMREGNCYLVDVPANLHHEAMLPASGYTFAHFHLSQLQFSALMEQNMGLHNLVEQDGPDEISLKITEAPMPLTLEGLLHELVHFDPDYTPPEQFLTRKIPALLRMYGRAVTEPKRRTGNGNISAVAQRIISAKAIIDENEGSRLKIPEIARKCFLNEQQLKKGFAEMFGIPINTYQTERRLKRAGQLLRATRRRVHHIASDIGYEDESSFSFRFKKMYGMTPTEFRELGGGENN